VSIFSKLTKKIVLSTYEWSYKSVLQIIFNEISAAELSQLDTLRQLELLESFKVTEEELEQIDGVRFGKIERDNVTLYRFRADDHRIYFEVQQGLVIVHRVLNKNSFSDFVFRSKLPIGEDDYLSENKVFWNLIDEGRNANRKV
jgi:mRNA-degrading endonuclease RelE of RelBE toxin-antitoxin system